MSDRQERTDDDGRRDDEDVIRRLVALGVPRRDVPPEIERRVRATVYEAWSDASGGSRHRRRWAVPMAVAASVVLAGLIFIRAPLPTQPEVASLATVIQVSGALRDAAERTPISRGAHLAGGARLETGDVGRAALEMADGTSVRLDHGTVLTLVADRRLSLESGAVYIDTASAGDRGGASLTIMTPHATATDIGTQFEVRVAGEGTLVRVREGEVRVSADGRDQISGAGIAARVDSGGEIRSEPIPVWGTSWDWTQQVAPPFDAEDRALAEFLAWSARELGLQLDYQGDSAGAARAIRLSGSVADMRPRDALQAVMTTTALDYRIEDGRLIVFRP